MPENSIFPESCLPFLEALAVNNNRPWFNEHKSRYEQDVRQPALDFIQAMAPELEKISPHFRAVAKKTGGSLMRVYRDTRFSKDKTPYKTNIGIQFRHEQGKDIHAPGFYLHIAPDSCFIGVGIWHPDSRTLLKIRDFLVDNPAAWKRAKAHRPFRENFELAGDSLKRPPRGFSGDHELIDDLKRKDFIALKNFDPADITKRRFVQQVVTGFRQADPMMSYLCTALEVAY